MESFVGSLVELRDIFGKRIADHVKELNRELTTHDIARLHGLTLGIVSNFNTGNYQRIGLSTILDSAQQLGFVYKFSVTNENNVCRIYYTIKLVRSTVSSDF